MNDEERLFAAATQAVVAYLEHRGLEDEELDDAYGQVIDLMIEVTE